MSQEKTLRGAMRRPVLTMSLAAAAALAGCNGPETITSGPDDPQAEALNKAAPVPPPPMIRASRTYRCKDNSLVYADFYTDQTAHVTAKKDGPRTTLSGAADGPFTADGWSISGSGPQVEIASPGHPAQSCKS